jgi:hypothetical protein
MLKDSSNSKIPYLYLAVLGHEDVLSLKISVKNLSVMNVLDSQSHLDKPIQYLILSVAY